MRPSVLACLLALGTLAWSRRVSLEVWLDGGERRLFFPVITDARLIAETRALIAISR